MNRFPKMTRLVWRLGRTLYMRARGEERFGEMSHNGETYVQRCVIANANPDHPLTILDIGANQGAWTASFLQSLKEARRNLDGTVIHAFEPVAATVKLFRTSLVALPGNEIVRIHLLAMSEEPGQAEIGVFADGAGTNSLHYSGDPRNTEKIVRINLASLDAFCEAQQISHIHLAKCDTEGHDYKVLKGAYRLLREERIDVLQFEYNHRWVYGRAFLKDVFELIDGLPYIVVRLNRTRLTQFDVWHPELDRFFQSNYALVHRRALDWFDIHSGHFDRSNTYA